MSSNRTPAAGMPPASSRAAATNRATSRWDGNSAQGRRCRDLFKSYFLQAGKPDEPAAQAAITALAEQVALAELARAECLAAGGLTKISLEMVIRAENLANRTLKRLKLDKPVTPKRKSFTEKLAEQEAAAVLKPAEAAL